MPSCFRKCLLALHDFSMATPLPVLGLRKLCAGACGQDNPFNLGFPVVAAVIKHAGARTVTAMASAAGRKNLPVAIPGLSLSAGVVRVQRVLLFLVSKTVHIRFILSAVVEATPCPTILALLPFGSGELSDQPLDAGAQAQEATIKQLQQRLHAGQGAQFP